MIAKIKINYVTMCDANASEKVVNRIVEEISTSILQEETLKELGINIEDILNSSF